MTRYTFHEDLHENVPKYDVFLSHASEDKEAVARPLAKLLEAQGLKVWYDETELRIGDNLVAKINEGINASRFGILVVSKAFFARQWTKYELDMLENLAVTGQHILFPIWHNITVKEIRQQRASLANIFARSTATHTIEQIAKEIYEVIFEAYAQE